MKNDNFYKQIVIKCTDINVEQIAMLDYNFSLCPSKYRNINSSWEGIYNQIKNFEHSYHGWVKYTNYNLVLHDIHTKNVNSMFLKITIHIDQFKDIVKNTEYVTKEELRSRILERIKDLVTYWHNEERQPDIYEKLDSLAFSILNIFDGNTPDIPAIDMYPVLHKDNDIIYEYDVINECQLHEEYVTLDKDMKPEYDFSNAKRATEIPHLNALREQHNANKEN